MFKKPSKRLIDKFIKNDSLVGDGYERSNVWEMQPDTTNKHPAPFPLELPTKCITYYSYEGWTVLDPFMGSGTTAKMAILNNRNWIGSEMSSEYCDIAEKRIKETQQRLF